MRAVVLATIALGLALSACQGSSSASAPPPASATVPPPGAGAPLGAPPASAPPPSGASGALTVSAAAGLAPGARALVQGYFFGWRGPCRATPPSRSAWQLAESEAPGAACLYVDGPIPPGANAASPGPPYFPVRVEGTLQAAGADRFIAAGRVERLPGGP
ncbi:MAG: hypothetical protein OZ928_17535 [Polyangiaceae bacterium]|nr:hypothetical protein [Polyangiaceae bacterium]